MAGIMVEKDYEDPDPDAVPDSIRRKYPNAAFFWLNEHYVNDIGWRGWRACEWDKDDPEGKYSPDSRVRSGDRFLGYMPREKARAIEEAQRRKALRRRKAIQRGSVLAHEMAKAGSAPGWSATGGGVDYGNQIDEATGSDVPKPQDPEVVKETVDELSNILSGDDQKEDGDG